MELRPEGRHRIVPAQPWWHWAAGSTPHAGVAFEASLLHSFCMGLQMVPRDLVEVRD